MPSEPVIEWTSADGARRLLVMRDHNAHYFFVEERFHLEDETAEGGGIYEYWAPHYRSGLYPSVVDAQNDASEQLPWLRDVLDALA
jgi:hypothetical protein